MRKFLIIGLIAVSPVAAEAQNMTVAKFLSTADALKKKGPLALLSGDIGKLKAEIQNSGKQLRAEQVAAEKAGRKPATCIPKSASINSDELLAYFNTIPPQQRGMPVKAGFAGLIRKKYPCPA